MKKLISVIIGILCLAVTFAFAACGNREASTSAEGNQTNAPADGNILVAYFSWSSSGNTEKMAKYIADKTGAEIYEIEPLVPYPAEYTQTTEVAREEKENNARPQIKDPVDVSGYDIIFIGFPIWWHTAPMIIGTFLESNNLYGKHVYPFFQGASNNNNGYYTETMEFINECASGATVHGGLYAAATNTEAIDGYLKANIQGLQ